MNQKNKKYCSHFLHYLGKDSCCTVDVLQAPQGMVPHQKQLGGWCKFAFLSALHLHRLQDNQTSFPSRTSCRQLCLIIKGLLLWCDYILHTVFSLRTLDKLNHNRLRDRRKFNGTEPQAQKRNSEDHDRK